MSAISAPLAAMPPTLSAADADIRPKDGDV